MVYRGFTTFEWENSIAIRNNTTGVIVKLEPKGTPDVCLMSSINQHIEDSVRATNRYLDELRRDLTPKQYIEFMNNRNR